MNAEGGRPGANEAMSLHAYLRNVDAVVKRIPSQWVRCELHTMKISDKFARMEFIELDANGKQVAKTNGGCFPATWKKIEAAFREAGLTLQEGSQVLVKMQAEINPAYGFNVGVLDIDVTFALGDLNTRIQAIRKSLRDDGHWDRNRRLAKPTDFVKVAVISPSGAAGLGDFRSTADRLQASGLVRFEYHEAPFQTRDAPGRIVDILRRIYREGMGEDARQCAVAIIRGGGASADLAWLVDHKLTEAVCRMNVPVMTGIGHERDRNLLDEVACIVCDTPSKVAEHISRTVVQAANAGARAYDYIQAQSIQTLDRTQGALADVRNAIGRDALEAVLIADEHVRDTATALEPGARDLLEETRDAVAWALEDVRSRARQRREVAMDSLQSLRRSVTAATEDALRRLEIGGGRAASEIAARLESIPSALEDDLDRIMDDIADDAKTAVEDGASLVSDLRSRIVDDAGRVIDDAQNVVTTMFARIDALDPVNVLAAGYAILRNAEGVPLTGVETLRAAGRVRAEMRDGVVALETIKTGETE